MIVLAKVLVAFKSSRLKVGYFTVLTIIAARKSRMTGSAYVHFHGGQPILWIRGADLHRRR